MYSHFLATFTCSVQRGPKDSLVYTMHPFGGSPKCPRYEILSKIYLDTNDRLFRCDKAVYAAEQVRLNPRIHVVLFAEMSLDYRPWSKGQHAIYELLRSLVNMIWAVVSQSNRSSHRIPLVFDFSSLALPGVHYM